MLTSLLSAQTFFLASGRGPIEARRRAEETTMLRVLICALIFVPIAGCATVDVYDEKPELGLSNSRSGIPVYKPVPHLLVRYGYEEKATKIETEVVMFPDLVDPYYIVPRAGWGTMNADLTVSNGILTNFSTAADSKGPETITAVGGLIEKIAGAYSTLLPPAPAPADEEDTELQAFTTEKHETAIETLEAIMATLEELKQASQPYEGIAEAVESEVDALITKFQEWMATSHMPSHKAVAESIKSITTRLKALPQSDPTRLTDPERKAKQIIAMLETVVALFPAPEDKKPNWKLFRIIMDPNDPGLYQLEERLIL